MTCPKAPPVWLFAYGSLLWRPDFAFTARVRGYVCGWSRRFWQGSTDHRGVPGAPGRVVTLAPTDTERCFGLAYRLDESNREATLEALDVRERGGYERHEIEFHCDDTGWSGMLPALMYLAGPQNPSYLGSAPLERIAEQARRARGPSGTNVDYVLRLHTTLTGLGIFDPHVSELSTLLDGAESSFARVIPAP